MVVVRPTAKWRQAENRALFPALGAMAREPRPAELIHARPGWRSRASSCAFHSVAPIESRPTRDRGEASGARKEENATRAFFLPAIFRLREPDRAPPTPTHTPANPAEQTRASLDAYQIHLRASARAGWLRRSESALIPREAKSTLRARPRDALTTKPTKLPTETPGTRPTLRPFPRW